MTASGLMMTSQDNPWATQNLDTLYALVWQQLVGAVDDVSDAFHWPTIATIEDDIRVGQVPTLRTVVLRGVVPEARTLSVYTDARSDKVSHLHCSDEMAWHVYCRERRVQLRLSSKARVHVEDEVARSLWETLPASGRFAYSHMPAPGTRRPQWHPGPPERWLEETPSLEETDVYFPNFAVCVSSVYAMEVLTLTRRGHYRARFELHDDYVQSTWLVP